MNLRKSGLFLAFSCILFVTQAQVNIPEGNFSIKFPNKNWKYFQTIKNDDKSVAYIYAFSPLDDTLSCSEAPILRINIEPNIKYESNIEFSLSRFIQSPFSYSEQFTEDDRLPNKDATAYYGEFTDSKNHLNKLVIVHFINKKAAIELRFITDESCFVQFENEFWEIIESIQLKSK